MLLAILSVIAGLALLVWSSDKFVDGAVGLAENIGMSKIMIGLTIVSLGTSAPEIFVSIMAATSGSPELALGNAIGSNIANIGLVLGATALIAALPVTRGLIKEDLPALLTVTAICGFLMSDWLIDRGDGLAMMATLALLLYLMFRYKREHPEENPALEDDIPDFAFKESILWFITGLVFLIVSSRMLVWGAIHIATTLGVSEIIIGLTIVAIGTSLPELAASIASAVRKHHDIALGNIIGSNILNLLAVLSVAAVIDPISLDKTVLYRDYGTMSLVTLLLAVFILWPRNPRVLGKLEGLTLLMCYFGYLFFLYQQSAVTPA